MFWHQFDLPKCQVNWGNAAVCLNVHFDGLIAYFLHFAPKTSKRTIDDLYDAAFESLMMFSHLSWPPSYSMSSSAAADSPSGTSMLSILAVFMLITNSNLVGS